MDDDEWQSYRKQAREWASQRDLCFSYASDAFGNGNKEMAKYYSNLGKECRKQMEDANSSAACIIFEINNEELDADEVDLHGLFVNEAIAKLTERIDHARNNGIDKLTVIVGQGNNSETGPKLKPAVTEFAVVNSIPYKLSVTNAGRIELKVKQYNQRYKAEPLRYPQSMKISQTQQHTNNIPLIIPSSTITGNGSQYPLVNTAANQKDENEKVNTSDPWFFVCVGLALLFGASKLFGWF